MATLANLTAAPATPLGFTLGNLDITGSNDRVDAGLAQSRLLRDYAQQTLPGIVNDAAAKGTFYGGQVGVRADQAKQGVADQSGDITMQLNRSLAALRRQGVLAASGVSL